MKTRAWAQLFFLATVTSCGDGFLEPEPTRIEVGTGVSKFEPIEDGEVVDMFPGLQGGGRYEGHHVWAAIRVTGPIQSPVSLVYSVTSSAGELVRIARSIPLRAEDGAQIARGLSAPFPDCCLAAGRDVVISARILDSQGHGASDQRSVRLSMCPADGPSLCP